MRTLTTEHFRRLVLSALLIVLRQVLKPTDKLEQLTYLGWEADMLSFYLPDKEAFIKSLEEDNVP